MVCRQLGVVAKGGRRSSDGSGWDGIGPQTGVPAFNSHAPRPFFVGAMGVHDATGLTMGFPLESGQSDAERSVETRRRPAIPRLQTFPGHSRSLVAVVVVDVVELNIRRVSRLETYQTPAISDSTQMSGLVGYDKAGPSIRVADVHIRAVSHWV